MLATVRQAVRSWARPRSTSVVLGLAADLLRPSAALVAENALLRQQLVVLRRQVKRPSLTGVDRFRLVALGLAVPGWRRVLHLVRPEAFLRWHRDAFRRFGGAALGGVQVDER